VKFGSEIEVMKALGIESWRNLSKDKVIDLASMMPDMDKEVALRIIEQLPEFTSFALQVLEFVEKRHEATLGQNAQSQQQVHLAYEEIRGILKGELDKELSWDQRSHIFDLLMETANREFQKDSENKQFLDSLLGKAAMVGAAVVASALVFVGGKAMVESGETWGTPQYPDS